jgi:hypothetical protein
MRQKHDMEYSDAPSGYVTLYNYKEPFTKYEGGHGYLGVLLFDGKTDKVQCHLCGAWENYLPYHLHREHNMSAGAYKLKVGLNKGSALLSEGAREKLIAKNHGIRLKNLRKGTKKTEKTKRKISKTVSEYRMEYRNTVGTCPEQLKERLRVVARKLGRTPTNKEIRALGFQGALRRVFGGYKNAIRLAGLKSNPTGIHIGKKESDRDEMIQEIKTFIEVNGRDPAWSDCQRGLLRPYKTFCYKFKSFKKAVHASTLHCG